MRSAIPCGITVIASWMKLPLVLVVIVVPLIASADERKWGRLEGQFIFDGDVPAPTPILARGAVGAVDESLVVDPKTSGIANILVWLRKTKYKSFEIHPALQANARGVKMLTIKGQRFDPHVLFLRTTHGLRIANDDPVGHNITSVLYKNKPLSLLLPVNGAAVWRNYPFPETLPASLHDNMYPWMGGWLFVQDHPYVAISHTDGKFAIDNLPVGTWEFQVWHERCSYVEQVSCNGKQVAWPKGRPLLTINEGSNDLGEIKINPALLRR